MPGEWSEQRPNGGNEKYQGRPGWKGHTSSNKQAREWLDDVAAAAVGQDEDRNSTISLQSISKFGRFQNAHKIWGRLNA